MNKFKLEFSEESQDMSVSTEELEYDLEFENIEQDINIDVDEVLIERYTDTHNDLKGRDAPNAHPISSISGLREELDSKATMESNIIAGRLLVASPAGGVQCCGHTIDDIAMKSDLNPDKTYIHVQRTASDVWVINHGLNKMPAVTIIDSAGTVVKGEITYVDMNNLILRFSGAFSGKALMN